MYLSWERDLIYRAWERHQMLGIDFQYHTNQEVHVYNPSTQKHEDQTFKVST